MLLLGNAPQGSLTNSLGNSQPDQRPVMLAAVLGKVLNEEPVGPGAGLLHHDESINLMPVNINLSGMEVSLVNVMSLEKILKQYLDGVKRHYDYVFLDGMSMRWDADRQRSGRSRQRSYSRSGGVSSGEWP